MLVVVLGIAPLFFIVGYRLWKALYRQSKPHQLFMWSTDFFEDSAHAPNVSESSKYQRVLIDEVLPWHYTSMVLI